MYLVAYLNGATTGFLLYSGLLHHGPHFAHPVPVAYCSIYVGKKNKCPIACKISANKKLYDLFAERNIAMKLASTKQCSPKDRVRINFHIPDKLISLLQMACTSKEVYHTPIMLNFRLKIVSLFHQREKFLPF
uniref:Uncharacterized protein n=1 Tax=Opuntia streptacantha TaxID=393608 RepID=A0A7C9AXB7_OPUST